MMSYYAVIKMMFMECLMTWENVKDFILSKKRTHKILLTILSETCKNCTKNKGILQTIIIPLGDGMMDAILPCVAFYKNMHSFINHEQIFRFW